MNIPEEVVVESVQLFLNQKLNDLINKGNVIRTLGKNKKMLTYCS